MQNNKVFHDKRSHPSGALYFDYILLHILLDFSADNGKEDALIQEYSVITSPKKYFFSKVRLIPDSARSDLSKEPIKSG